MTIQPHIHSPRYRNVEQSLKAAKAENETLRTAAAAAPALAAAAPATLAAAHAASPVPKPAGGGDASFLSPTPPYSPPSNQADAQTAELQAKVGELQAALEAKTAEAQAKHRDHLPKKG